MGFTFSVLWLSQVPAETQSLREASSGEVPLCMNFSNCIVNPPDYHFTIPGWEDTAQQASVFLEDKETDLTGPSRLPRPAQIPAVLTITLGKDAARGFAHCMRSKYLWRGCNLQREQEVKDNSVIGCCEPCAVWAGEWWSMVDTSERSLSDPAERTHADAPLQ